MLGLEVVGKHLPKVADFYLGKSVFVTGAGGYIRSQLLENLLRNCPGIKSIFILLRSKKNVHLEDRQDQMFNKKIFDKLKEGNRKFLDKVHVIAGDASLSNLGMSEEDIQLLTEEVSIAFHCAATINFSKPLKYALLNNVLGFNSVIELGRRTRKLKHRMPQLSIQVCFSTLLQASLSSPILNYKPKPVDLSFFYTEVIDAHKKDFEHDDVPVILLHGMTGNKESWHGISELISLYTKKKVCVADLRNHGESPWNDEEYDVVAMTEDVRHLMDRINAPKAIILGHSLGGRIGVHLALNYPERVEKLIVEDMRPNGIPPLALAGVEDYARMSKKVGKLIPQGVSEKEAKQKVLQLIKEYFAEKNMTFVHENLINMLIKCSDGKCQLTTNPVLMDAVLRNITELINESSGRFNGPALFIYGAKSPFKVFSH